MKQGISDYAWLFKASGSHPTTAVISAHGGTQGVDSFFQTPVRLYFLEHCGKSVTGNLEPTIQNFDPERWSEKEPAGTTVNDSVLTKFQGRHAVHHGKLRALFHGRYEENYSDIERVVGDYAVGVVTIRNRLVKSHQHEVTLSMVLAELAKLGYQDVICLYCRGYSTHEYVNVLTGQAY